MAKLSLLLVSFGWSLHARRVQGIKTFCNLLHADSKAQSIATGTQCPYSWLVARPDSGDCLHLPLPQETTQEPQGQNSCSTATLPINRALGHLRAEGKYTGTILQLKCVNLGVTAVRQPHCL